MRLHRAQCTYAAQDVVLCCESSASLVSSVYFCGWGAAEGLTQKVSRLRYTTLCSGTPGRHGRGGGGLEKSGLWCTACDVSRVSLVRARAARAE